ncbi:hypothetical protein [Microvirga yunnanensis]|uniref:hypothetical protein n=1 Tax=Microvirga yunnanensis TaxID=2953740 RepID=UPI0021C98853|nr:hypothetical protein [Microvirga sp. HBU65207]
MKLACAREHMIAPGAPLPEPPGPPLPHHGAGTLPSSRGLTDAPLAGAGLVATIPLPLCPTARAAISARSVPLHVITGLVPVIPMRWGAALQTIGMAGTSPAMTGRVGVRVRCGRERRAGSSIPHHKHRAGPPRAPPSIPPQARSPEAAGLQVLLFDIDTDQAPARSVTLSRPATLPTSWPAVPIR